MSILIDSETTFCIQGITGKQGRITCTEMLRYGSKLVCGVTPGKGGQEVEGLPVYGSMDEAVRNHTIDCTVLYVPPKFAKGAILEAIASGVQLIVVITENIPIHDFLICYGKAVEARVRIIGPTSIGIFSVGKSKCGSIASGDSSRAFSAGRVGVISKSGGMTQETALVLKQAGLGVSTAVGIGGDVICGSTFCDVLELFEKDTDTDGVVLYGEVGGVLEEDVANMVAQGKFTKPIVAFVSGVFAQTIENVSLGHAGAIIESGKGGRDQKVKALKDVGVMVANVHHEIGVLMKKELEKKYANKN